MFRINVFLVIMLTLGFSTLKGVASIVGPLVRFCIDFHKPSVLLTEKPFFLGWRCPE